MSKAQQIKTRLVMIAGTCLILMSIGSLFGSGWPLLQVEAGPTLPPRGGPTPNAPSDSDDSDDDIPIGAYIELYARPAGVGLWAVVQWQDSAGQWHDVEGWRGIQDENGYRRWWVAARDFDKGPFRWGVAHGPADPVLAVSDLFDLPDQANQVVTVDVTVK